MLGPGLLLQSVTVSAAFTLTGNGSSVMLMWGSDDEDALSDGATGRDPVPLPGASSRNLRGFAVRLCLQRHMTTLVIVAVCFLALGIAVWAAAVGALRRKRWLGGGVRVLLGLLFITLAALAGAITIGIQGYRALTYEEVAATVKTDPLAPQRFRATILLPNKRLAMYELAGDA